VTNDNPDERLLGAVARALVAVDELRELTTFRMPYPPTIQRALDELVLHRLCNGAIPPMSVPELVRWGYDRPLSSWALELPVDVYSPDAFLVDVESGVPTTLCHEIALSAEIDNPLREASRSMAAMASLAAERNQPSWFSTMREVLATYPVLTTDLFNNVRLDRRLGFLDEHLGDFYHRIGQEYEVDGEVFPCASCGIPLRRTATDSWWCEREECQTESAATPGDPLDCDAKVLIQLDRRHRQFVLGPARAALRVADSIGQLGARTRRWPMHGACDLRVELPESHAWNVAVVDWNNPALLGRAIAAAMAGVGVDTTVWVVAQYRVDAHPDYLRIVREHAIGATGSPPVYSEDHFTDMVRLHGEERGRA
jgi:hypothetical protein